MLHLHYAYFIIKNDNKVCQLYLCSFAIAKIKNIYAVHVT